VIKRNINKIIVFKKNNIIYYYANGKYNNYIMIIYYVAHLIKYRYNKLLYNNMGKIKYGIMHHNIIFRVSMKTQM